MLSNDNISLNTPSNNLLNNDLYATTEDILIYVDQCANNETTVELRNFWLERYKTLLENQSIFIAQSTLLLLQSSNLSKPATPLSFINLAKHCLKKDDLEEFNEDELQVTIDTAIRLLDSFLTLMKFDTEAEKQVQDYRKIALTPVNFDSLVDKKILDNETIGEVFSNLAYRSSESLAEEKGVCRKWDEIKYSLKSRMFEYWYNLETGDIKSGDEISLLYTQEEIIDSHFEIVPRRNSHILAYPNDIIWQKWSDRDIKQSVTTDSKDENAQASNNSNVMNPSDLINYSDNNNLNIKSNSDASLVNLEHVLPGILPQDELSDFLHHQESENHNNMNSDKQVKNKNDDKVSEMQTLFESEDNVIESNLDSQKSENLYQFQTGEIVKIKSTNKLYQILSIDSNTDNGIKTYSLTDNDQGTLTYSATEDELITVSLEQLLTVNQVDEKIESTKLDLTAKQDPIPKLHVELILLNEDGQLVVNNNQLPISLVKSNETVVDVAHKLLSSILGNNVSITLEEVGLYQELNNEFDNIEGKQCYNYKLGFFGQINRDQFLHNHYYLNSTSESIKLLPNLDFYLKKMADLDSLIEERSQTNHNLLQTTKRRLDNAINKMLGMGITKKYIDTILDSSPNYQSQQVIKKQNSDSSVLLFEDKSFKASKISTQMQQVVVSSTIGRINISVFYTSLGPSFVRISTNNTEINNDFMLQTYVNLVNTSLNSGTPLSDIADIVEAQNNISKKSNSQTSQINNQIAGLLDIVSQSLRLFPNNLFNIDSEKLIAYNLNSVILANKNNSDILDVLVKETKEKEIKTK
jgi:Ribonucleotide reductase, barrel domain